MSERTRAAVYQRVLGHGLTRRSQATQRGQNRRTQAVGKALAKTEACSQELLGDPAGHHKERFDSDDSSTAATTVWRLRIIRRRWC